MGGGHQAIAVENLALRRQLAAYRKKRKRPVLTRLDRSVKGLGGLAGCSGLRSA